MSWDNAFGGLALLVMGALASAGCGGSQCTRQHVIESSGVKVNDPALQGVKNNRDVTNAVPKRPKASYQELDSWFRTGYFSKTHDQGKYEELRITAKKVMELQDEGLIDYFTKKGMDNTLAQDKAATTLARMHFFVAQAYFGMSCKSSTKEYTIGSRSSQVISVPSTVMVMFSESVNSSSVTRKWMLL